MKMVVISADEYEKLKNEKKESETKIDSYKQCIAGYESRIKELTEERDKFKDQYSDAVAKRVLNSAYGVEQDICCKISNSLNKSMADKVNELSEENKKLKDEKQSLKCDNSMFKDELLIKKAENEKLKKESAEKSEWLKAKDETLDNLIIAYNKLEKEHKKLKDCKYMYENKLKNTEAALKSVVIDKHANDSFIKTLRSQAKEDANKMKELRQKYEAVLKANEKLAAENNRLANDPETIKLSNELIALKKQYRDLNNAYKSQKNELTHRKKLLTNVTLELNNIYEHMKVEASPIEMLAIDLRKFMR